MNYQQRIIQIHKQLSIAADYAKQRGLPLQHEATHLVTLNVGVISERHFQLIPAAAHAWEQMFTAAKNHNTVLNVGSAFRSVDYQTQLIESHLSKGRPLDNILSAMAAPGYSEHHTGRALDIITCDSPPFSEAFESTAAFLWLQQHAARFNFHLSFPRGNPYGFVYEPWHWCFRPA